MNELTGPVQGLIYMLHINPWRCAGLLNIAPLGLSIFKKAEASLQFIPNKIPSFEYLVISPEGALCYSSGQRPEVTIIAKTIPSPNGA